MSSIQSLERQVAELRQLVRLKAGVPDVLQAIAYGGQTEAEARKEALNRVPEQWRGEVQVRVIGLPWLTGRAVGESRINAVRDLKTDDQNRFTPAVVGRGGDHKEPGWAGEAGAGRGRQSVDPLPPSSPTGGMAMSRGPLPLLADS